MDNRIDDTGKRLPPGSRATLTELLTGLDFTEVQPGQESCAQCRVGKITCDSRAVEKNDLFIALPGSRTDGHKFVAAATEQNCAAVVVEAGAEWQVAAGWQGTVVEVADCRQAYARVAENYYGQPAEKVQLIGITGTNGKTTTTYLLEDVLKALGYKVGVIGTINYRYQAGDRQVVLPSPFTTPEAMQLQALLFEMTEAGVEYVIMEVSSHALEQQRIGNLQFDIAGFTNLSRDHLDYHATMEEYFAAKTLLFANHLKDGGRAVISTPQQPGEVEDWSGKLAQYCRGQNINLTSCGQEAGTDIQIKSYDSTLRETHIELMIGGRQYAVSTPLVGHFNVDNYVTALGLALGLGIEPEVAITALSGSTGAPGRLQRVMVAHGTAADQPVIFVDYAHTPDALKQVLATVKALPHNDLYCIFGCGGDRDNGKRPVMGGFAGQYADVAVVTDDNPRTEDPELIRSQILPGVIASGCLQQEEAWLYRRKNSEHGFVQIGNRREAIAKTIKAAGPGDIVLIAGKGHEKYQLGRSGKQFFDDCLEAETALYAWNLEAVLEATGGRMVAAGNLESNSRTLQAVSTDSRTIGAGDIFVALRGDNFDGHDFLAAVAAKGAGCAIVENGAVAAGDGLVLIDVDDTLRALGALANYRRRLLGGQYRQSVVAITGSCGKTTVKEMTAAIMRRKWPAGEQYPENAVLQTRGNLNNLIGLPLSLLPITPHTRAAVLEMGMNAAGEIRAMAKNADADICCITNVHPVHLEGLKTIEGVAAAKEELFQEARAEAVLIINLDDPHTSQMAAKYSQQQISFSRRADSGATVLATDVRVTVDGMIRFTLHLGEQQAEICLHTVGDHNVFNALAAAAIGVAAGASLDEIAGGLADFRPADRRMVQLMTEGGVGVLNDTYNANPASMVAAMKTLTEMSASSCAAVLGDMLELGEGAQEAHRQLGGKAAELGVNYLAVVGEFKNDVAAAARAAGMTEEAVAVFDDKDKASEWIQKLEDDGKLAAGDWILVKASRGLRMETIVASLTGKG